MHYDSDDDSFCSILDSRHLRTSITQAHQYVLLSGSHEFAHPIRRKKSATGFDSAIYIQHPTFDRSVQRANRFQRQGDKPLPSKFGSRYLRPTTTQTRQRLLQSGAHGSAVSMRRGKRIRIRRKKRLWMKKKIRIRIRIRILIIYGMRSMIEHDPGASTPLVLWFA